LIKEERERLLIGAVEQRAESEAVSWVEALHERSVLTRKTPRPPHGREMGYDTTKTLPPPDPTCTITYTRIHINLDLYRISY
jgi:hypothetical protein